MYEYEQRQEPTPYEARHEALTNGVRKPVAGHPGFTTTDYSFLKLYGVSINGRIPATPPRHHQTLLFYNGVQVREGSRSDLLAILGHAPTRQAMIDQANGRADA